MIYLYIKQHSITGLKYFGKTIGKDPFKYPGSGKYWNRHLKIHGKNHIQTLDVYGFDNQELCTEFALKFSKDNNIVESKEWANLIEENGLDGWVAGKTHSNQTRLKLSKSLKGRKLPVKVKISISLSKIGIKPSNEARRKMSNAAKRRISESTKGRKWWNNTHIEILSTDQPIGYILGRIKR